MYLADLWHSHHWIDVRDWATAIATAAAAWLAYIAIRYSRSQAKASADALLDDRHTTYTLEILRDLAVAVEGNLNPRDNPGYRGRVQTLLHLCPERMPMTRAAFDAFPTEDELAAFLAMAVEERGQLDWFRFETGAALDEIAETAQRLLGSPGAGPRWQLRSILDDARAAQAAERAANTARMSVRDEDGAQ
jgi:hypothetical protein